MRIITGKARGLKLKAPRGMTTRPTADRIKESLFNVLNGMISFDGRNVLDLFAGSGALGLESLSRGASTALFIDRCSTEIIADNLERSKLDGGSILRADVLRWLARLNSRVDDRSNDRSNSRSNDRSNSRSNDRSDGRTSDRTFELIFADPPYHFGLAQRTLELVVEKNILAADGLLILEHGGDEIVQSESVEPIRKLNYGRTTAIDIFGRKL